MYTNALYSDVMHALKVIAIAAAIGVLMTALRLLLIEPDEVAVACLKQVTQGQCLLRDWLILGFVKHWFSYFSLATAALAWLTGRREFAMLAIASGMMSVVLYDFERAAPGLLLGCLSLMHSWSRRSVLQQSATE